MTCKVAQDYSDWPTGRLLSTAARLVEHRWNVELAEHGLTMAGLVALHVLGSGPLTQRELALRCQVQEQTMSRTLERLERTGHVRRARDGADRRRVLVERTAAGNAALLSAGRAARGVERDVLGEAADSADFRTTLEQIVFGLGDTRWPPSARPLPGDGNAGRS